MCLNEFSREEIEGFKKAGKSLALYGSAGVLGLGLLFSSYFSCNQSQNAVVTLGGKIERIADAGYHWKLPWESVAKIKAGIIPVQITDLETLSNDTQVVTAKIDIQYQIPKSEIKWLYANNPQYEENLHSIALQQFKNVIGEVQAVKISTNRGEIQAKLSEKISEQLKKLYHLNVINVGLNSVGYDAVYTEAQEKANTAKVNLERSRIEQMQKEVEAETRLAVAKRDAESQKVQADADKYTDQAKGDAIAHNQLALSKSIPNAQIGEVMAKITAYRNWDGKLPHVTGGAMPLLKLD